MVGKDAVNDPAQPAVPDDIAAEVEVATAEGEAQHTWNKENLNKVTG